MRRALAALLGYPHTLQAAEAVLWAAPFSLIHLQVSSQLKTSPYQPLMRIKFFKKMR
jgi:hypothetical protein